MIHSDAIKLLMEHQSECAEPTPIDNDRDRAPVGVSYTFTMSEFLFMMLPHDIKLYLYRSFPNSFVSFWNRHGTYDYVMRDSDFSEFIARINGWLDERNEHIGRS